MVNSANFSELVNLPPGINLSTVENIEPTRETSSTKSKLDAFFSNNLSSFQTTDSGISDQHTVTLTFEQSLKKSSNEHKQYTKKWAKLENRKNGEDLNNILLDKFQKKLPATVVHGPLIKVFEKLHEIVINILDLSLPNLDLARTGVQKTQKKITKWKLLWQKKFLRKMCQRNLDINVLQIDYKAQCNSVRNLIKQKLRHFYQKRLKKKQPMLKEIVFQTLH